MVLKVVHIYLFCRRDVDLDWVPSALHCTVWVYWMKNIFLCKVLLKLIVWEESSLRVVDSIYSIVGIGLPEY